jgi:hypothetical protein
MIDQDLVLRALNKAALIAGHYLEPGHPRDPIATMNRLVEVLDDQKLAAVIKRMEIGRVEARPHPLQLPVATALDPVPELTRNAAIKLNERVLLQRQAVVYISVCKCVFTLKSFGNASQS